MHRAGIFPFRSARKQARRNEGRCCLRNRPRSRRSGTNAAYRSLMFWFPRRAFATILLPLLLLGGGATRAFGQNLLTNGDFSNIGTVTLNNNYASVGTGGLIPGWSTIAGNAANAGVYVAGANSGANWIPKPQSGPYAIQLDSTSNNAPGSILSSIQQGVTVTAGQSYLLSFWFTTEV